MTHRKPRGSGPKPSGRKRTPGPGKKNGPFANEDYDRNLGPVQLRRKHAPSNSSRELAAVHDENGIRLQKLMASAGVASRRVCEDLIAEGRVEVDDIIVTEPGVRVDTEHSIVRVDGIRISMDTSKAYYAFNKPRGVISTMEDPEGRPCISDYVKHNKERLFHVGRLDNETEGLLLLTNDGELANRLSHPKYEIPKTYLVQVHAPLEKSVGKQLREGVKLDDGFASVDSFKVVDSTPGHVLIEVVLHSGKNHIVRRMFKEVGYPVQRLVRIKMGPITLSNQKQGSVRPLTSTEIGHLNSAVNL